MIGSGKGERQAQDAHGGNVVEAKMSAGSGGDGTAIVGHWRGFGSDGGRSDERASTW